MAKRRDDSVGKKFTDRDELAFDVYRSLINGRMSNRDACEAQEGKTFARLAYMLTDAFLAYRRDA